jgi:RIO kinase 1
MKIPPRLIPLVEDGVIDEVMGQVKSGKEADVFVVRVGEELRCAKVYKEANNRSFRQAVQYQEGRKVRSSRDARAIGKRSRYGQREAESSWINAEVEALNTLSAAGLRVPRPFGFFDGVLIMELVVGEDGEPAPRLNDITLSPETAFLYHEEMISQIVRMLCAGIIHGDLSEFNVLVDADGPVIIDLPQAVNAAGNNSAGMLFARDVDNMARYFGRFAPEILGLRYAKEIWALYEKGKLTPHVELTGQFREPARKVDVGGVLDAIGDARKEHEERHAGRGERRQPQPEWSDRGRKGPHQGSMGAQGGHKGPQGGSRGPQDGSRGPQGGSKGPRGGSTGPQGGSRGPHGGSKRDASSGGGPSQGGSWGRRHPSGGPRRGR